MREESLPLRMKLLFNVSTLTMRSNPWPLRILSIIWGLLIPPAVFLAFMSLLVDVPGPKDGFLAWILFLNFLTAPLVLLISCVGGLIVSFRENTSNLILVGKVFMVLPSLNIALFLVWVLISVIT